MSSLRTAPGPPFRRSIVGTVLTGGRSAAAVDQRAGAAEGGGQAELELQVVRVAVGEGTAVDGGVRRCHQPGGEYVDHVVPGIIVLGAMSARPAPRWVCAPVTGVMDRFRTMPIRGAAVLVGHVVSSLLRNIVLLVLAVTWLATAAGLLAGSVESANALGFAVCSCPT
jgi:hypothetical protein